MRKQEYLPWITILLVSGTVAITSLMYPDFLDPILSSLGKEISGTLIGFSLALSGAEIIKIYDRWTRERNLTSVLIKEVNEIIGRLDERTIFVVMDMWDMAISSGDLCIFASNKLYDFKRFYANARVVNSVGAMQARSWERKDEDAAKVLESAQKQYVNDMCRLAEILLKAYG